MPHSEKTPHIQGLEIKPKINQLQSVCSRFRRACRGLPYLFVTCTELRSRVASSDWPDRYVVCNNKSVRAIRCTFVPVFVLIYFELNYLATLNQGRDELRMQLQQPFVFLLFSLSFINKQRKWFLIFEGSSRSDKRKLMFRTDCQV